MFLTDFKMGSCSCLGPQDLPQDYNCKIAHCCSCFGYLFYLSSHKVASVRAQISLVRVAQALAEFGHFQGTLNQETCSRVLTEGVIRSTNASPRCSMVGTCWNINLHLPQTWPKCTSYSIHGWNLGAVFRCSGFSWPHHLPGQAKLAAQACLLVALVSSIISPITFMWGGSWVWLLSRKTPTCSWNVELWWDESPRGRFSKSSEMCASTGREERWNSNTQRMQLYRLVGGLEHFLFSHILKNNHPNWLIFFRGVQTTNQFMFVPFRIYSQWWSEGLLSHIILSARTFCYFCCPYLICSRGQTSNPWFQYGNKFFLLVK